MKEETIINLRFVVRNIGVVFMSDVGGFSSVTVVCALVVLPGVVVVVCVVGTVLDTFVVTIKVSKLHRFKEKNNILFESFFQTQLQIHRK